MPTKSTNEPPGYVVPLEEVSVRMGAGGGEQWARNWAEKLGFPVLEDWAGREGLAPAHAREVRLAYRAAADEDSRKAAAYSAYLEEKARAVEEAKRAELRKEREASEAMNEEARKSWLAQKAADAKAALKRNDEDKGNPVSFEAFLKGQR